MSEAAKTRVPCAEYFALDEPAAEVLKLVDGKRTLAEIVYAPRSEIENDVQAMLQDLSEKGALRL